MFEDQSDYSDMSVVPVIPPGNVDISSDTVQTIRASLVTRRRASDENLPMLKQVRDLKVEGTTISCRLYVPHEHPNGQIALFLHGGGFVLGNLDTHDGLCRHIAHGASMPVISLDYSLAPESPYPAAVEDCVAALSWLLNSRGEPIGIPVDRIIMIGESAGGAIAIDAFLRSCPSAALNGIALLYPVIDHISVAHPSYDAFATGYGLTKASMDSCWQMYLANQPVPRSATPQGRGALADFPPIFVAYPAHDILRDEAEAFARLATEQGVQVGGGQFTGTHGFIHDLYVQPEANRAFAELCAWIVQRGAMKAPKS